MKGPLNLVREILEISATAKMQIATGYISGRHRNHLHNETSLILFLLIATLLSINLTILYLDSFSLWTGSIYCKAFFISSDECHYLFTSYCGVDDLMNSSIVSLLPKELMFNNALVSMVLRELGSLCLCASTSSFAAKRLLLLAFS